MSYQQRHQPQHESRHHGHEARFDERRSNPHRPEFDPQYDPSAPPPAYQRFPQPIYDGYQMAQPTDGRQSQADRYESRKFDYRYDDRFHRQPPQQQHEQQYKQHHKQQYQQHHNQQQHQQYEQQQPPDYGYNNSPRQQRYSDDYHSPRQQRYSDDYHSPRQQRYYDDQNQAVPRAGRANNYNTRITDLLTSIRDPDVRDDTFYKMMETNKGYLVMMRFRPSDLSDVVTAIQESLSTLAAHHGYVIGFSEPQDMRILIPSNQMMANDTWWDARNNRMSRYAVCCFWFKDIFQAKRWFESAPRIKQPDFPNSSPYQVVAVPLTYGRNKEPIPFGPESDEVTLLWSEYPNIYERYHNDFLVNYSEPARQLMKGFGANPNVSVSKYKAGWPNEANKYGQPGYARFETHHERVGRAIRTGWVLPETFITVSTFPSMDTAVHFYRSDEYQNIRDNLSRYSDPVFVAVTLRRVKGTSRA